MQYTTKRGWSVEAKRRRERRLKMDLTLGTVADRLGVWASTIYRWERGAIRPNQTMERAWDAALYREVD